MKLKKYKQNIPLADEVTPLKQNLRYLISKQLKIKPLILLTSKPNLYHRKRKYKLYRSCNILCGVDNADLCLYNGVQNLSKSGDTEDRFPRRHRRGKCILCSL